MKHCKQQAQTAELSTSLAQRIWAVIAAVALCVGLVPSFAVADDEATGEEETFSVALTIVDTTDEENGVIYNAEVSGMTSEDTVADLLAAAGFTEVSTAEETLASDSYYYDSWGSPTFRGNVTTTDESGNWIYWCTMFDGDSANYASASLTATLTADGHYQYIYGSASTFSYDDEIADPLAVSEDDSGDADGEASGDGATEGGTSGDEAAGDAAEEVTVALTIVDTTDSENGVICNEALSLSSGSTVADLLAAAGFTEVSTAEETLASDSYYYDSWGSPTFRGNVTTTDDAGNWIYWCTMFDGDSANYASASLTATLQDGGHYQYIYGSASTFSYDDEIADPLAVSEDDSGDADGDGATEGEAEGGTSGDEAAGDETETFTVALTIVDTTDDANGVIYNGAVSGMTSEDTVADLLAAAGFTEVLTADETLESDLYYYSSWGSPTFRGNVTSQDESGNWLYWCTMFDGDSANYASAVLTATLVEGGHYQYIYGSGTTFSYDTTIADPLATSEDDSAADDDSATEDDSATDDEETGVESAYDAESTASLLANLSARFSDGGSDEAVSNSTAYAAIALNSLGLGGDLDADAILESLEGYESSYGSSISAGTLAKYIMALTAAGVDCTDVEVTLGGETVTDLVAYMEELAAASDVNAYSAVFILPVYGSYGYEAGDADIVQEMIDTILENSSEGLVGGYGYYDTETTAQAVLALLPYADDAEVSAFLAEAEAALLAYQNEDGGFGYASYSTDSNLDATAYVVAALVALGYDCADGAELTTSTGASPISYLVSMADSTLDGYNDNSSYDEAMTSATVLLGLAAQSGYDAAEGAFNVYGLQTVAESDDAESDDSASGDESSDDESADGEAESDDEAATEDESSDEESATEEESAEEESATEEEAESDEEATEDEESATESEDEAASDEEADDSTGTSGTSSTGTSSSSTGSSDGSDSSSSLADTGDDAAPAATAAGAVALCALATCLVAARRKDGKKAPAHK